ncbi:MAG: hypothetical protein NTV22_07730 [bacterium]|nr:hypothetical protein [bacterium]
MNDTRKNLPVPSAGDAAPHGQLLVYTTADGRIKIEVRLEQETVWLTQQHMAQLFQTTKQNIGQHLKNIFVEGELHEEAVVKDFFTTAADSNLSRPHTIMRPGGAQRINAWQLLSVVATADRTPNDFDKAIQHLPPPKRKN